MAELVLENVTKIFANGVAAVRDLNLRVEEGELIVLVGPSGSGKTTTLRLIAGLERPSRGSIRFGHRIVNDVPPQERDVAIVFQRHTLYPHLDVRHNLQFGRMLRHTPSWLPGWLRRWWAPGQEADWQQEAKQRVEEAARLLELEALLERKPAELSGGQQQRVALGRALVREPSVFLLDEPLGHLDSRIRGELRRQLHLLHRRIPATMIYVTHDPVEAMILGDRVAVLDEGAVLQTGRPATVYDEPANCRVARFFGWPSMNLIDGKLASGDDALQFVHPEVALAAPASWKPHARRAVTVGIRPQDLRIKAAQSPLGAAATQSLSVWLVETLGSTCLVTLRKGGLQVSVEVKGRPAWREGETVEVIFDMERAHLFDGSSGQALVHGRPEG